jgi:hypothetical protein
MKITYFNRKKRQFGYLSSHINKLIKTHQWERLDNHYRTYLISRLNHLFRQLCNYFTQIELKKILAGAAIFIGLPLASQSQSFALPVQNPFGLNPDSVYVARPALADIDNDGDYDLFAGVYEPYIPAYIHFNENIGTINSPNFDGPQDNPFGLVLPSAMVVFPDLADLDNDGDLDLLLGVTLEESYFPQFQYYENTGTPTEPAFAAAEINPFGLIGGFGFAVPKFADIDNDGDLDLFSGEYGGNLKFYENTGTPAEPDFAAPVQNPFGITAAYQIAAPAFSDMDQDGDLDLLVGEYYGNFQYYRNSGTVQVPAFAPPLENPFGLIATYEFNMPAIADLDDDGDDDILVGEYYGMFQYFQNTDTTIGIHENLTEGLLRIYPNPATNEVFIQLPEDISTKDVEASVIDLNGRILKTSVLNPDDQRLRTNDLPPGIYFVRIVRDGLIYTGKLVIR